MGYIGKSELYKICANLNIERQSPGYWLLLRLGEPKRAPKFREREGMGREKHEEQNWLGREKPLAPPAAAATRSRGSALSFFLFLAHLVLRVFLFLSLRVH